MLNVEDSMIDLKDFSILLLKHSILQMCTPPLQAFPVCTHIHTQVRNAIYILQYVWASSGLKGIKKSCMPQYCYQLHFYSVW